MSDDEMGTWCGMNADPGERGLVQRLRRNLAESMPGTCPHVLLGFSGGADSLALLIALCALERLDLQQLTAVHVDHGVRQTSAREAHQVAVVADTLGVRCEVWTVTAEDLDRHQGVGLEEALRRERYRAFAEVSQQVGAEIVATAHHQRDQAETVLLHLLRGSGLRGASGMRALTELTIPWWDDADTLHRSVTLWRPFLGESVTELHRFVADLGLPVIEDRSNDDPSYRRNAIRHEVLPVLERLIPGSEANLAGFARLAADDDDVLELIVTDKLPAAMAGRDLRRSLIRDLPVALQRRLLRRWILGLAPRLELSSHRVEAVRLAATGREGGVRIQVGSGWLVVVAKDLLRLEREP